jgi:hypothetical protein
LNREGRPDLSAQTRRFVEDMPPVRTEKEFIAADLINRSLRDRSLDVHKSH